MSRRCVQVFLLLVAVGLGAGARWYSQVNLSRNLSDLPTSGVAQKEDPLAQDSEARVVLPSIEFLEQLTKDTFEPRLQLLVHDALEPCPTSHVEKLCRRYGRRDRALRKSWSLWSSLVEVLSARSPEKAVALALENLETPLPEKAVLNHFRDLAASDPTAAIVQMKAIQPGHLRDIVGRAIVEQLCQESPVAALEFAVAEDVRHPLSGLLKKIPASIGQLAEALRDNEHLASLRRPFATEWGELDPTATLDWAMGFTGAGKREIVSDMLTRISYTDPLGAFDRMAAMPSASHTLNLIQEMLPRMIAADFDAAVSRLLALPANQSRWFAVTRMAEMLRSEPVKAAVVASALDGDGPLLRHFQEKIRPPEVATPESLAGMRPRGVRDNQIKGLMLKLTEEKRFDEGAAWIESLPGAPDNLHGIREFAQAWAKSDPQKVADWAAQLQVEGYRKTAIEGLIEIWSKSDPATASEFIEGIADDAIGRDLKIRFAESWAYQDPLKALRWAVDLPFNGEDSRALVRTAGAAAYKNPDQVAGQFSELFPSAEDLLSDTAVDVAGKIAESWSRLDPSASLTWAQQLPAGRLRNEAEATAIYGWAKLDSRAASEAVAQIPDDRRDPAAAGLVQGIATSDPDAAWEWSLAVQDTEWQNRALESLMSHWRAADPDHAREKIADSSLPADVKENLYLKLK